MPSVGKSLRAAQLMGDADSRPRPAKIRKHTYVARKEEGERLSEQVESLTAQATALRERKRTGASPETVALVVKTIENASMRSVINSQNQLLGGVHAMLSDWMHEQQELPLASYIHLTCDFEERRRMLMEIKPQKLQAAEEFLHDHYQHLDLLRPYAKKGQFENAQGDYCTTRVEIVQFEGVKSVREVFDAALYSSANLEIMVSEKLGHLTLREEYDTLDEGTWNARLLSSDPQGIKQEMNVVSFAQFRADHYVKGCELPECGVIVTDVVDKDDLYPYKPNDNLRRDVSVMVMMTPHRRPRMQQHSTHAICEDMVSPDGEGELVVVLQHIVFEKLHRSDLPINKSALRSFRRAMSCWGDTIVDGIHDRLAALRVRQTDN